ncbi:uncharacterized protein TRIVIDRAFT_28611 [Trichoderma virens Gv29-8]|uniref:Siderophore biosynthesis enzyme n=1 Tax=Hypocrea virens (strain Gv29-8 / FGSC 10586) TaxID=413071 RepID=G9MQW0_HYPVG|nr:uncharacterized protein TRIVIDRAFT_28611 [Trichoderma virens Gv29-8]EHK22489.1 hypothetical protein TRIVIDRAFT_28611 [Trichoderma virens Gv29-8]UKZ47529.1 hypothetical protein TrVGV298_001749 [Trichoderma virens]
MRQSLATSLFSLLVGANVVFSACETHSFTSCQDGIVHWFDPNNGQVCDPLDCGGGRAPIKTDVPGCPAYSGTLSVAPISILSCWKPSSAIQSAASTTAVEETKVTSEAETTSAPSTSEAQRSTEKPASETSAVESTTASDAPSSSVTTAGPVTTSASTSVKAPITSPATLSTKSQSTHAASNGTSTSTSAAPLTTHNAGNAIGGSLMAVAGAVIGAIAML